MLVQFSDAVIMDCHRWSKVYFVYVEKGWEEQTVYEMV